MATADIAPVPQFPERVPNVYERKIAAALPGNSGPLRFEEGVATDTDVPNDFRVGVMQGIETAPGRPNHNKNVYEKPAAETMHERAHVGSASWVEAEDYLNEFGMAVAPDSRPVHYDQVDREHRAHRLNPAVVRD